MHKDNKTTKDPFQNRFAKLLKVAQNNVWRQAALALLTVVLALILIFAMSAAWYTNVVKTGDLIFQVEQWGFSGSVEIGDVPILAAPGDSGIIELSMTNSSNDLVAANVSILKSTMSTDMQKRLYFYADTSAVVNDETVERIYLTGNQSYTYQIFSQGLLTLSETVSNDVQLKWFWVYDVLGYYVQGVLENENVTVSEYLRPVEYSYDEAKTTFDEEGKLLTIDGNTTVEALLEDLSRTDGYEGTITVDENKWTKDGFYPISVDENGKGVWIKFLSYSEIEKEIITDTAMGTGELPVEAKARLTITAENVLLKMETVSNVEQLQSQLQTEGLVVLQLTEDITVDQLTVSANTQAIIDLNGNTITGTADQDTIVVEEGGSLTMMDGQMLGAGKKFAITPTGAEITLSNVKVSDYERAVVVQDHLGEADSTVRLVGCDINTSDVSLFVRGNADKTETKTRLIIENTTINSGYVAICGNGNPDTWGTDIQIINSKLTGYYAAIYHPQKDSSITVSSGSMLTGYTGVAMKAGSLYVMDSSVIGTGEHGAPSYAVSGFSDTGDGIYVEANYGHDILVEVSGDSVITGTQDKTFAVQVYEPDAPNVTVRIFGGSFSTSVAGFLADDRTETESNGRFMVTETKE